MNRLVIYGYYCENCANALTQQIALIVKVPVNPTELQHVDNCSYCNKPKVE